MSWLSKTLGLDKHPDALAAINAVGASVLSGIEASSPLATTLINAAESAGAAPVNPITVISTVGTVLAVFDPKLISQVEAVTNTGLRAVLTKFGRSEAEIEAAIAEIDAMETVELVKLGFKPPVTVTAPAPAPPTP